MFFFFLVQVSSSIIRYRQESQSTKVVYRDNQVNILVILFSKTNELNG